MSTQTPLLDVRGVTKQYAAGDGSPTDVLKGVSLSVVGGETVAIMGPSGCGKSTLLNIIGTLDRPTGGNVLLDGRDLASLDDEAVSTVRNSEIGFVFQLHHLLPQCSVLENVLVPTLVAKSRDGRTALERAGRLLERVGLSDRLDHRPGQLSGGERQRVAVVRALINRPALLLADEPTGSLDRHAADDLCSLLGEFNTEEGVAVVMVTHAERLAATMQTVYELNDGRLAARQ